MSPAVPFRELDDERLTQLQRYGATPAPLYHALANQPELLGAWIDFAWRLRSEAITPRSLRELMILRCAQLADCAYQWDDHLAMARSAGVDDRRIEALDGWRSSRLFTFEERLALAFTEEVVAGRVTNSTLDDLRAAFSPAAIVELTLTASFYVMVPRVVDALRVSHGP